MQQNNRDEYSPPNPQPKGVVQAETPAPRATPPTAGKEQPRQPPTAAPDDNQGASPTPASPTVQPTPVTPTVLLRPLMAIGELALLR